MKFHCVFVFFSSAVFNVRAQNFYYPGYTQSPQNYYPRPWNDNRNNYNNFNVNNYDIHHRNKEYDRPLIDAPFMALIFADHSFEEYPFMTGVIINNYWILTTAKTLAIQEGKRLKVFTGVHNFSSIDERYANFVTRVVPHPNYRPEEVYYDIGLVKVQRPIDFNQWQTRIVLISQNELSLHMHYNPMKNLTVYNYGSFNESSYGVLKEDVIPVNTAVVDFRDHIFIAAYRTIRTCYGDSGSPAVVDGRLVGLLIIEDRCFNNFPNVFISISHFYDWIMKETKPNYQFNK
ncbi:chymotrypsin-2-like [Leptopilina boulardi]|uniref:chymotrypsin-2-like n=1 Tax=Leptopilina boulardi TaxID=63433 RepID=UPI0021F695B9|nr:chymotrypsin-2-like [Leptopilina boulardi]